MILTLLFLLMCVACVSAAVRTPQWFWTVNVGSIVLVQWGAAALHQNAEAINVGPFLGRVTDPALLGILVGVLYHAHRDDQEERGLQFVSRSPVGGITLCIFLFMAIKLLLSILFRSEDIMSTYGVSHSAGGIIAAAGDLRDSLAPFLPLLYVYAVRKSRDIRLLGWPTVVLVGILLLRAALGILIPDSGSVSDVADAQKRFIPSEDAINLTIFGFLLLFLRVQGLSRFWPPTLGGVALVVATLANHRSQWLALAAGLATLLLIVAFGPPIGRNPKPLRVGIAIALLTVATLVPASMYVAENRRGTLLPKFLGTRLLAFTDPSRDPDANFRERIWRSQIDQVGSDWLWGRPFGARAETLIGGRWYRSPSHSAYVSIYGTGGVILCVLTLLFWYRVVQIAWLRLLRHRRDKPMWPALVALTTSAYSLAYGSAYYFPLLGPALAVILTFDISPDPIAVNPPCYRTFKGPDVYLDSLEKA
jgi:hypothetical protein